MAPCIYLLCALTSLVCTILLTKSYLSGRSKLLLWSSLCFIGLTLSNGILFVDLILVPEVNLAVLRLIPAFIGLGILAFGLIWEGI